MSAVVDQAAAPAAPTGPTLDQIQALLIKLFERDRAMRTNRAPLFPSDPAKLPALFAALAKAQGAFPPIAKNRHVQIRPRDKPAYEFDFADLDGILQAVRPALSANGLGIAQPIVPDTEGNSWLVTLITHGDGGILESRIPAPSPTEDPKIYGGLITYMRRYMLSSALCIAADDDLDDNGNEPGERTTTRNPPAPAPARKSASASAANAEPAPAAAPGPAAATGGDLVGEGQLANLRVKIKALGLDADAVTAMLVRLKVAAIDAKMTQAEWKLVKAEVEKAAR